MEFDLVWKDQTAKTLSVAFWNEVLKSPTFNLHERADEVVFHVKLSNRIIAVSTAKEILAKEFNNNPFFSFRLLIHPAFRIPGLLDKLSVTTIEFLERLYIEQKSSCIGVITLIDNPDLLKRREAIFPSTGLTMAGYTKAGRQIRVRYFKGARINPL